MRLHSGTELNRDKALKSKLEKGRLAALFSQVLKQVFIRP
jgi:hypothetical protein